MFYSADLFVPAKTVTRLPTKQNTGKFNSKQFASTKQFIRSESTYLLTYPMRLKSKHVCKYRTSSVPDEYIHSKSCPLRSETSERQIACYSPVSEDKVLSSGSGLMYCPKRAQSKQQPSKRRIASGIRNSVTCPTRIQRNFKCPSTTSKSVHSESHRSTRSRAIEQKLKSDYISRSSQSYAKVCKLRLPSKTKTQIKYQASRTGVRTLHNK